MKKNNTIISFIFICLTIIFFNSSEAIEVDVDEGNKVLKINASDLNITDDNIVKSLSSPYPLSVSDALCSIQYELSQNYSKEKKIYIDLSGNTICDEGALLIGKYFSKISNLKKLNISWNRITDKGIYNLIYNICPALTKDCFVEIDITGNYGANTNNLKKIINILKDEKIKTKIKY